MANSLTFNDIDPSIYGLVVTYSDLPVVQDAQVQRVGDKAYAWRSSLVPKVINLGVDIRAASFSGLQSYVDSIKAAFNTREDAQLILDSLSDRYWLARFESLLGRVIAPTIWRGNLAFLALDPLAHSTTLTETNLNVDADPDTLPDQTPGGTANTNPVYTLTAGEALGAIEVTLENLTTGLALVWSGTIADEDELIIDVANKQVDLNDAPSMATVSGRFPYLLPTANSIKVTGWGDSGTLDIVYRARYL